MREDLLDMWIRHEGFRSKPYRCSAGKLTIGYGRNLDDVGISKDESEYLARNDLKVSEGELRNTFIWFEKLDEVRQDALINMNANLGLPRFLGFKKTISYIESGQYEEASQEMLDSRWAEQVGGRAHELSEMMRLGHYLKKKRGNLS